MKRSLLAILLIIVMVCGMMIPAAGADGLLDKLKGLKEKIGSAASKEENASENYVVEKLVKQLVSYIEAQCKEKGIGADDVLEQVMGLITGEDGSIDLDELTSILSMITGGSGDAMGNGYITQIETQNATVVEYIKDMYKELWGPDDVVLVTKTNMLNDDFDMHQCINRYAFHAYSVDGKDLNLKASAEGVLYLEFDIDEDSNFTVTNEIAADDGENRSASIDALCEKLGVTRERYESVHNDLELEWNLTYDLEVLLENNEAYDRVEYRTEMKTAEEMAAVCSGILDVIYGDMFAEGPAEE